MPELNQTRCVVTGAARGIGKAICAAFIAEGAHVILTDLDIDAGSAAAKELGCEFFELDVTNENHWAALSQHIPRIDVMVNNAGITGFEDGPAAHDPENVSLDEWRRVHATNLEGTMLGCQFAITKMKGQGTGSIINISSRSGLVGIPGAAAYASSKAAIINHSKTVALYCAQQGWQIRCNAICPAAILTDIWEPMLGDGPDREEKMAALVADTPLKRFGMPEEVAAMALMLASDGGSYITGTAITMDGGLLAGSAAAPG